jgi:hypothetical protein
MHYPDLPQFPLPCLPDADPKVTRNVTRLANALQRTVAEAAIALNLFDTALIELDASAPPGWFREEPECDASLERVRQVLAAREPRSQVYYDAAPQLHARTFVLSLRMLGLYLQTIAKEAGPEYPNLLRVSDAFEANFPSLKHLRDSIIHTEDRLRHLDRRGKDIIPEPVPGLTDGGGVFFSGLLNGRSLGWTLGDGGYAECEISAQNLATAMNHVFDVMFALGEYSSDSRATVDRS